MKLLPGLVLLLVAASLPDPLRAQQLVAIGDTGSLNLEYAPVRRVDAYDGRPLMAEVRHRPGEALSLVVPYRVQQVNYRVPSGSAVSAGQAIAELIGPEVHHFMQEYDVAGQRLEVARSRYESNRTLHRDQAISQARWAEISNAYFDALLAYEHLRHFRDLVSPGEEHEDSIVLHTPAAGILVFNPQETGMASGAELATVIPSGSLRLRVAVPLDRRHELSSLSGGGCVLGIDSIAGVADHYFAEAWSEPLGQDCELMPGQRLQVTPAYRGDYCLLPDKSLLRAESGNAVFLRRADTLVLTAVAVVGTTGTDSVARCSAELENAEVLVDSVAAVHGMLQGFGGE